MACSLLPRAEGSSPPHLRESWCSLNEGLGKVLRYGAYGPEVIERLRWMSAVLGPSLQAAVQLVLGLKKRPNEKQMEKLSQAWRPWRTVAARILWIHWDGLRQQKREAAKAMLKKSASGKEMTAKKKKGKA